MTQSENRIASLSGVPNASVKVFETLDSTNTEARRQAEAEAKPPLLIIAEHQSAGRGRMGRSFYSPARTGLYMTALLEASESLGDTVFLTTAAAVSVARAIDKLVCVRTEIKWVNDVYLDSKKICGILCESFETNGRRYVSVGVGVNLSTRDFPPELSDIAASLFPEREIATELAAEIFGALYRSYYSGDRREMLAYYKERSFVLGRRVFFFEDGEKIYAEAYDIDEYGRLAVRLDNGEEKILSSGEITLRLGDGDEK